MERADVVFKAFKEYDLKTLRAMSDEILSDGFMQQDPKFIRLAIITHALSKVAEKDYYKRDAKYWENFVNKLGELLNAEDLDSADKLIVELDSHFGRYKEDIVHMSRIRKGTTLYAWGASLTLAAELVGVPEYELMSQIGKTKIVDEEGQGKSAAQRMKDAEDVL